MWLLFIKNAVSIWLFLLTLKFAQAQQCLSMDYQIQNERDIINISSPNYPNAYTPGSNCRHRITAPRDHVVILTCLFEVVRSR